MWSGPILTKVSFSIKISFLNNLKELKVVDSSVQTSCVLLNNTHNLRRLQYPLGDFKKHIHEIVFSKNTLLGLIKRTELVQELAV